jgi:sRNA-binding protein
MPSSSPPRDPVLAHLVATYPVFRDIQPLAIGIHKAIIAAHADIDKAALRRTLQRHTASTRYLKVVAAGDSRFGLDGVPTSDITETGQPGSQGPVSQAGRTTSRTAQGPGTSGQAATTDRQGQAEMTMLQSAINDIVKLAQLRMLFRSTMALALCAMALVACSLLVGVTNSPPPPNAGSGPSNEHR